MLALKRAVVVSTFRTVYSARLLLNATQGSFLRLSFCSSVFCSAVAPLLSPSKSCLVQAVPPPFQHFILVWFLTNYNKFHQVMQNATSNSQLIECGISRLIFTFFSNVIFICRGPLLFLPKSCLVSIGNLHEIVQHIYSTENICSRRLLLQMETHHSFIQQPGPVGQHRNCPFFPSTTLLKW